MSSAPVKKPAAAKPSPKAANKPAAKTGPKSPAKTAGKPVVKANISKTNPAKSAADRPAKAPVSQPTQGAMLRARDLVARVAQATDTKVKDIKATVEATLAELGRALDAGEELNLPPLGRVKITPAKNADSNAPMKLKLRRGAGSAGNSSPAVQKPAEKEPLAEVGEDS